MEAKSIPVPEKAVDTIRKAQEQAEDLRRSAVEAENAWKNFAQGVAIGQGVPDGWQLATIDGVMVWSAAEEVAPEEVTALDASLQE